MFSIYNHWNQALRKLNLMHGELKNFLALSYELMPYPILVFQGDTLLAVSPQFQTEAESIWNRYQQLPFSMLTALLPDGAPEDCLSNVPILIHSKLLHGRQIILCSRIFQQQHIRILAAASHTPLSPGDLHLMQILADAVCCNLSLWQQKVHTSDIRSLFLSIMQDGSIPPNAAAILRQLHWEPQQRYTVFWFEKRNGSDSLTLDKLYQLFRQRYPDAFCFQFDCAVLLLCNPDRSAEIPDEAAFRRLLPADRFVVGQSNIGTGLAVLPQLAQQAHNAMLQAREAGRFALFTQQVLLDYMHQSFLKDEMLQSLVHPAIRRLQQYDAGTGSQLLRTLWAYLYAGGNRNAAAKTLLIHRNTLSNNWERIQSLTNVLLDDPHEREALLLSLLIACVPGNFP